MTYLTQQMLQKPGRHSPFLSFALIGLVLITLQATPARAQWTTNGNNISNTNTGGNVGINSATPVYTLDVNGSIRITSGNSFHLTKPDGNRDISFTNPSGNVNFAMLSAYPSSGTDVGADLSVIPRGAGYSSELKAQISIYNTDLVAGNPNVERLQIKAGGSKFAIFSGPFGSGVHRPIDIYATGTPGQLYLATSGNVGIGTTAPTAKLHVAGDGKVTGNLTVDGNLAAKYQDIAEWVPASSVLPAGTVVTLDPTKSNHVEASSKAYDTRVAGVISAQPGISLGEHGDNKVLVATTGRVRLKADASSGPIEVGDLLVTSDVLGLAMKSKAVDIGGVQIHRPSTIIGKALEPLAKGRGEILVLLSLQ